MSIQVLRDGQIERRRNERQASLRRRSSRLRALNAVTAALTQHVGLPSALYTDFDASPPPPLTAEEAVLLDSNDLDKGRYFQDSAFPFSFDFVKDALAKSFPIPNNRALQQQSSSPDTKAQLPVIVEGNAASSQTGRGIEEAQLQGKTASGHTGESTSTEAATSSQIPHQDPGSSPSTAAITSGATPLPTETSPATSFEGQAPARQSPTAGAVTVPSKKAADVSRKDQDGDIVLEDRQGALPADIAPVSDSFKVPTQPAQVVAQSPVIGTPKTAQTPKAAQPATPSDKPQRMQTRVSSGAMRQKSVSEIIQESPRSTPRRKPPMLHHEPSSTDLPSSRPSSSSRPNSNSMPAPPLPARSPLTRTSDLLQQTDSSLPLHDDAYSSLRGANDDPSRDYLEPLYRIQAQEPPNARGLGELLHRANKALTTRDQFVAYRERQDQRLLKRVYGLQYSNHWSLRQMQPCQEPPAPTTHWDHVMSEMKWMRTDFKQERKEKKSLAKYFAQQCADWVVAEASARFDMQVRTKIPQSASSEEFHDAPQSPAATSLENGEPKAPQDENVPDLEPSGKEDQSPTSDHDMPATPLYAAVPDALFTAAGMSELTSHMLESDDFTKAIQDLPLYKPFDHHADDQRASTPAHGWPPSVSKYITGKILAKTSPAPRKRSRFDYEDECPEDEPETKRQRASKDDGLAPEQTGVALFDPENKPIKDRLHATNIFRPPSEFNMPSEKFYEWRLASQWTWDDDQKLRKLAKDYTFNWSLIADQMGLPSHFHGAADRRTPWECFERWVELETLPVELRKTNYFRAWVQRLEGAARLVDAKYQAQLQLHSQNPNPTQPPMKRRTMPVRVERRRTGRYLHIIDSMRKLARKREQQAHKQHEAQKAANMRKNHVETNQPKANIHTPQEFSKLRHERDMQLAARQEKMREAMLAQQKAAQMQRAGQHPNQAAMAAAQQRQGNPQMAQSQNGQVPNMQATANMSNQNRQMNGMQNMPMQTQNGHLAVPNMGMQNGVPQAPMQNNMRSPGANGMQMSQEAMSRMAMQSQIKNASQLSAQQIKQFQQQQMLSPGGNQMMNGMSQNGQMPNNQAAMLAAMQQQQQQQGTGQSNMNNMQCQSGQMNGGNASVSPHMPPPNLSQPKQLSSGHVPAITQIKHQLQAQNPNLTPQQLDQLANERMKQQFAARQNAVNAASGNYGNAGKQNMNAYDQNQAAFMQNGQMNGQNLNGQMNNFSNMAQNNVGNGQTQASPNQQQQYSQMMRRQLMQQQQSNIGNSGMSANGSPHVQHAVPQHTQSPVNMHVSPVMQGVMPNMAGMNMNNMNMGMGQMNGMNGMNGSNGQQRPSSRNAAPGMARIPSNGGMVSPGLPHQGSPRAQMVKQ